ncbi:MAG: hypothetical protein DRJ03_16525 [Chloroflexi bacterium]|nr:MAG: hypothetical protein DRJ03_16525 [Chloroflexota bacterium]
MTENTMDAPATGEQGRQELPVPEISGGSGQAGSAGDGLTLASLAETIQAIGSKLDGLDDLVDARVKSAKDKNVNGLFKQIGSLERIQELLTKFEGNTAAVERELAVDKLLAGGDPGRSAPQVQDDSRQRMMAYAEKILTANDISFDDPDVVALTQTSVSSVEDYFEGLTTVVAKKLRQGSVPASAATGTGGSQSTTPAATSDAFTASYLEDKAKIRQGDVDSLMKLKWRYADAAKEQGVEFDPG